MSKEKTAKPGPLVVTTGDGVLTCRVDHPIGAPVFFFRDGGLFKGTVKGISLVAHQDSKLDRISYDIGVVDALADEIFKSPQDAFASLEDYEPLAGYGAGDADE